MSVLIYGLIILGDTNLYTLMMLNDGEHRFLRRISLLKSLEKADAINEIIV